MNRNFMLAFLASLLTLFAHAAPPTVSASNLVWNLFDGSRIGGTCTAGNGSSRIFVMKQGSPVTGVPVNGVDYTSNTAFGTAAAAFTAPGEYVIGKSAWGDFSATNLQPGTVYYVAVFERNGNGTSCEYLNVPLSGSASTVVAPTVQTFAITTSGIIGNSVTLNWTRGNGTGRLILARKASAVDAAPVNLTNYFENQEFGNGTQVGTGNFVVYKGTGATATVKNLEPNTTYHFAFFEYNGSTFPMFLQPAAAASVTTNAGPTTAPHAVNFNYVEGNRFHVYCSQGNGTRRLFVMRKNAAVTAVPSNGTVYAANAAFGTPGTEIAPDEFVVGAGAINSVAVTNLEPNTAYHFRIYEYDQDKNNSTYYLTSAYAVRTGSTALIPTTLSTLGVLNMTGSSAAISMSGGNGSFRMVILRSGSAVDAAPTNLTVYPGNNSFGSGTHMGNGNYVVAWGINGSPTTVSNLQPGVTYHAAVYEFNGQSAPVYSTQPARISFTIPLQPTQAATAPWTTSVDGKSLRLLWNSGNGGRRIVIARKGAAVTALPLDGTSYNARDSFGLGSELLAGQFVVYQGTGHYVDVKNLDFASTYHFAVFEFNTDPQGNTEYLTSAFLAHSVATVNTPTTQPALTSVTNLQSTSATINFTAGNGHNRILIMRQGSPVDAEPVDGVKYSYSSNFGTPVTQIGTGNYVILTSGSSGWAGIASLQPNTTYYISAFEYNGTNEPMYLRTGASTLSFTTPDVPGATVPTTAASAPIVNGVEGNKVTFKWTSGNGASRIVVMRKNAPVSFVPAAGTSYAANAAFGSGTDLGSGQFVVYSSNGATVDLTNLEPSSTYHLAVYEFNGTGSLIRYGTAMTATAQTLAPPATPVSSVQTGTSSGRLVMSWSNGSGTGRLIIVKEGAPVTAVPVNLSVYPANAVFGSGPQAAAGEYVVYNGNGSTVAITGLVNGRTYHYAIYEYNGSTGPVYLGSGTTGSAVVSSALPVQLLYFRGKELAAGIELSWATSMEWNHERFELERSQDGVAYTAIRTVAGSGNSNTARNYQVVDATVPTGTVYYRLKQVDRDGAFTYSSVVVIRHKAGGLQVSPNPVRHSFRVALPAGMMQGELMVSDLSGRTVTRQGVAEGQQVDASRWPAGVYVVRVVSAQQTWETTIVKQ